MHGESEPDDIDVTMVPWYPANGPRPLCVIKPYPDLVFLVFKAEERDGYLLQSDIGHKTFLSSWAVWSAQDNGPTMQCLRAALSKVGMELFIPPVVIDDTDLFLPRLVV